jgi:uncharacterized protein YndB with AHSA1/START domain
MTEIVMEHRFEAAPERVFAAITDHVAFGRWVGADIRVERAGTPAPNGLGAIRAVGVRGLTVREEVVGWEAPRAMDYRVVSGAPFRNHRGEIRLTPDGSGTRVDYRIRFEWPWYLGGGVVGRLLAAALEREITAGLARMAADVGGR